MRISLGYDIEIDCAQPMELVALLDPAAEWDARMVGQSGLQLTPQVPYRHYTDSHGNRCLRLTAPAGGLRLTAEFIVETDGRPDDWSHVGDPGEPQDFPDAVMRYLLPSRYCETDVMMAEAWERFGATEPGWERIRAIFDHVNGHIDFGYVHARATRTASEAQSEGRGVCRDFAHLAITLCRCMNIPARYVNGFMGDIGVPVDPAPMDYNAWAEVWAYGRWITLDARHNIPRIGRVAVARGRDASDVPLLHSFGPHGLTRFEVRAEELAKSAK
ncbi:transglutaminase-like domain-containing protein [Falsigemmobacter faecalis]|uniref:Transglutaminase family protein n=1 Tax=Falsigemmobacter faecalis TaxID=2488730 RepID=A0A3P3DCG3_9RHOB|nr:transglutaminase family protein [Falsigemmobacter faecalis]RRH70098.1 transglutaminase family protein [Falsigemmobacter faecalis]